MDKRDILDRLDIRAYYSREIPSIRWNGKGEGVGLCPFHDDHTPSFSVNHETGQWNCFGECKKGGNVFDFYMVRHGVDFSGAKGALAREAGLITESKKIIKVYNYQDEAGNLLFQTVRYQPKDFKQRRPDGNGGWIYNLHGVRLIPYHLPEVLKAKSVIIVEGEKDADNLKAIGLTATTSPMGAGKWRTENAEHFRGKRAVILPDNDDSGKKHAQSIAASLKDIAESVKVCELAGLPRKGDVSDYMAQGGTKEKLIELIKQAPEWTPADVSECLPPISGQTDTFIDPLSFLKKGSDLQLLDCKVEWVVEKLLPKQSITLFHGRGGIGKTWLSLILADSVSKGIPFMGLNTQTMPVVYVDFENSLPVLVERVRKIGAEDALFWHNANEIMPPPKIDNLKWEHYKALPSGSLVIYDTLRAAQGQDENDSQKMAFVMARLKELRDKGFSILLLHHTPKSNDRTYKGSTAILDLADHVLSLHKVRKNNLEVVVEDEEAEECFYRFGTKDKTRYEPFHLFMSFDKEKGFIKAIDPDTADMESICEILKERGVMNQKQIYEAVKCELDIQGKGKVVSLLRKGEGIYWRSYKDKKAILYETLTSVRVSSYIGPDFRTHPGQVSESDRTHTAPEANKNLDNSEVSKCPGVSQTHRTQEDEQRILNIMQSVFPGAQESEQALQ